MYMYRLLYDVPHQSSYLTLRVASQDQASRGSLWNLERGYEFLGESSRATYNPLATSWVSQLHPYTLAEQGVCLRESFHVKDPSLPLYYFTRN